MAKGIIYLMTTVVPGLVKIGKTGSHNFEDRMRELQNNGYRNVTGLKKKFAIEVEDYDDKEILLHTIFEKSRVSDTELFAIDDNIAVQLLAAFDGTVIYPKAETKEEIFDNAAANSKSKLIPNGTYYLKSFKKSDNRDVNAKAKIENGKWTILKGSTVGVTEGLGISSIVRAKRDSSDIDINGKLLEDVELGECSPSFAGSFVRYTSTDGWVAWKDKDGTPIDIYRKKGTE